MTDFVQIVKHFDIKGGIKEVVPFGAGLINTTYRVVNTDSNCPDYILQKINNAIFKDVDLLQKNIELVTNHIRSKLVASGETDIDRKILQFVKCDTGKTYYNGPEGYWRVSVLIPRSKTLEVVNAQYSEVAGVAFGKFQAMLSDLGCELEESIPLFHNMEFRLQQLRDAVKENKAGRLDEVKYYVDELEKRADEMCKAEKLHREGKLPKRVCHCDTKVNNILFDEDGSVLCVIDLDTVMSSYIFSDVGDFLRYAANTGAEDDKNLDNVNFNMEIFKAFIKGYLSSAKSFLLPIEIENLPYAAALFPYMQTVRFLADYINGDTYYKIKYPDHNLVRTKAQFKLLQSVEAHMQEMKDFIASL
ncbi:hypothetical protein TVAG_054020 [Trichomonas vaginalis G3]|uniref:Aminoglycoside phosphotransferase domain-containing protein n=1 Tax=Trichomonas vaginalis (strain ATCC PRA-98 / G3) TaxID=412133 RepID=A2G1K4_TRIV3|nr:phosphotransferase enzyme family [Trichomonas vaginalis G3]EAX88962.1 hypothetical protein TVAG_054020 [Trichomonas vaginalis G3]KAI5484906.1 phosphotransferase enzyme family [Trichomonas vaginalis G3]|eukprot:XP_001301892.1 hypothetical protein [Trichomonas vaginalis G3]